MHSRSFNNCLVVGRQPLNQLHLFIFLYKCHSKQLVLVQLSLAVTQKVTFLPFPVREPNVRFGGRSDCVNMGSSVANTLVGGWEVSLTLSVSQFFSLEILQIQKSTVNFYNPTEIYKNSTLNSVSLASSSSL